ncbi:MAG: MarC family protein [Candidatus Rokuibacteriota bacterium]
MRQIALTAFATFFVTVMPVKAAPFFAALTDGWPHADRRRAALKSVLVATVVLLIFGIWGDNVLRLFGISLAALRVGGGILLLLVSIGIVSGPVGPGPAHAPSQDMAARAGDIAVFPMAMPVIAGPATITAVLVLISEQPDMTLAQGLVLAMLLLVLSLTLGLLLLADWLERVIGTTALGVTTRVFGILLAALAAEMILQGIRQSGAFR